MGGLPGWRVAWKWWAATRPERRPAHSLSSVRRAGVGEHTAAGVAEIPLQVGFAVFGVASEVVRGHTANIVSYREDTACAVTGLGVERIEDRARRWYGAARAAGGAGAFGRAHFCVEVHGWVGMAVFIVAGCLTDRANAVAQYGTDLNRGGRIARAVGPVGQVGGAIKVQVAAGAEIQAAGQGRAFEAGRVIFIAVSMHAWREMADFDIEADIVLARTPVEEVSKFSRRVLWPEVVGGGRAGIDVQALEAIFPAGHHETCRSSCQIVHLRQQPVGRILQRHAQGIALVHQQRVGVGREGSVGLVCRSRRAGGNAVGLDEGEIDRLSAVGVAGNEIRRAFQTVDVERGTPVRAVTADTADKRVEARRIELQL